jgi:hypothetical protein
MSTLTVAGPPFSEASATVFESWNWERERAMPERQPQWYPDPTLRNELRYWDGQAWTDQVSWNGAQTTDPFEPDVTPHYRYKSGIRSGWRCLAHNRWQCVPCKKTWGWPLRVPQKGEPQEASGVLPCPHCGCTHYKEDVITSGDIFVGVITLGSGGTAIKSRCLRCGFVFKQG